MSHSAHSIPLIFPPDNSGSGGSASSETLPQSSHSISSIFQPYKSTESSESNERLPQCFHSIPLIFPPTESTNSSSGSHSKQSDSSTNESTHQSTSIQLPELQDLHFNEVKHNFQRGNARSPLSIQAEDSYHFQAGLKRLIEEARQSWTYGIMWGLSYDHSGWSMLRWADGYYKGKNELKSVITGSNVDDKDVSNTGWFFLKSKMQCFLNGSGHPGQAFVTSRLVWVTGFEHLASSSCNRARMGQVSGLQTMVWIPSANGIVELGSTELIFQSTDLTNKEIMMEDLDS
ncbi:transcription factor MYC2 [Quercus suber]|uniref:transcription factor MYC2 n=1 Tax=Quercus suber TaxID=58331 RepID=UPI0032DF7084